MIIWRMQATGSCIYSRSCRGLQLCLLSVYGRGCHFLARLTLLRRSVTSLLGFPPLLPFCLIGPTDADFSCRFFPGGLPALLPVLERGEGSMRAILSSAVLLLVLVGSLLNAFPSSLRSRLGVSGFSCLVFCAYCA